MHIPSDSPRDVLQVWFIGSHHDLGSHLPSGTGLVNIALSWMMSEMLFAKLPIRFQPQLLAQQFPRLQDPASPRPQNHTAAIHSTYTAAYKATGYKTRVPGSFGLAGLKTNERIHQSVRLRVRNLGPVIPGHFPEDTPEGHVWKQGLGSWGRNGTYVDDKKGWGNRPAFMDRTDLKEAEKRDYERRFLG